MNNLYSALLRGLTGTIFLSSAALLAQFTINVILARHSAELVGNYSILIALVAFITTFFVFGGNVLAPFFKDLNDHRKVQIFYRYCALTLIYFSLCRNSFFISV